MLTSQHTHGNEHMKRYAVKIGEITLQAERPITTQDQERAKEWIESGRVRIISIEMEDRVEMYANLTVDRH
jgi:hypothetical protein